MGAYCHGCGEHFLEDRLSFRVLAREAAAQLSLERGLFRTFRKMLTDPGEVVACYLRGQRRSYLGPVAYLFFGAALMLLVYPLYESDIARAAYSRTSSKAAGNHPLLSPDQVAAYTRRGSRWGGTPPPQC